MLYCERWGFYDVLYELIHTLTFSHDLVENMMKRRDDDDLADEAVHCDHVVFRGGLAAQRLRNETGRHGCN